MSQNVSSNSALKRTLVSHSTPPLSDDVASNPLTSLTPPTQTSDNHSVEKKKVCRKQVPLCASFMNRNVIHHECESLKLTHVTEKEVQFQPLTENVTFFFRTSSSTFIKNVITPKKLILRQTQKTVYIIQRHQKFRRRAQYEGRG